MSKRLAKLNVSKINKNNIKSRTYVNNEGQTIEAKELEIELIDLKEPQMVLEKDNRRLMKVGFITEKSFKDASGNWKNGTGLGDIVIWEDITPKEEIDIEYPKDEPEEKKPTGKTSKGYNNEPEINVEDIPF